jgi:hypothetical protein
MKKTFCDICGDELENRDGPYRDHHLEIESDMDPTSGTPVTIMHGVVCTDAGDGTMHFRAELKDANGRVKDMCRLCFVRILHSVS